jgi:hypothetical protein
MVETRKPQEVKEANMACETTSSNLIPGHQTMGTRTITDIAAAGYCTVCGQCCCNCEMCRKETGKPVNMCAPCHRKAVDAKKGGA